MSDNQSENSVYWSSKSSNFHEQHDITSATIAIEAAQERYDNALVELQEAQRAVDRAKSRLQVVKMRPKRHEVFNPPVKPLSHELYTLCMQLGYSFCIDKGTVHYVGQPGEGLIDTGLKLEDLPT